MSWLETSIMARRGVAQARPGAEHTLTLAEQGTFHYVYGPYARPVLTVDPGAVVACETYDAFEGKITSEADRPSERLRFPFLNPQNGPIAAPRRATASPCMSARSARAGRSRSARLA